MRRSRATSNYCETTSGRRVGENLRSEDGRGAWHASKPILPRDVENVVAGLKDNLRLTVAARDEELLSGADPLSVYKKYERIAEEIDRQMREARALALIQDARCYSANENYERARAELNQQYKEGLITGAQLDARLTAAERKFVEELPNTPSAGALAAALMIDA